MAPHFNSAGAIHPDKQWVQLESLLGSFAAAFAVSRCAPVPGHLVRSGQQSDRKVA
jgi:hypothetical protein